jgi:hypothetical protein
VLIVPDVYELTSKDTSYTAPETDVKFCTRDELEPEQDATPPEIVQPGPFVQLVSVSNVPFVTNSDPMYSGVGQPNSAGGTVRL